MILGCSPWHGGTHYTLPRVTFVQSNPTLFNSVLQCLHWRYRSVNQITPSPSSNLNNDKTVEDAPAPSALHSFKAEIVDGKIKVTADPTRTLKNNMSRPPKLSSTSEGKVGKGNTGVVIVGGGSGAFHAVESMRENGYTGNITILSKENYPPIDRFV